MKVTDVRFVRRFNVGQYEHEEYEIRAAVDEGDDPTKVLEQLKKHVAEAFERLIDNPGSTTPMRKEVDLSAKRSKPKSSSNNNF